MSNKLPVRLMLFVRIMLLSSITLLISLLSLTPSFIVFLVAAGMIPLKLFRSCYYCSKCFSGFPYIRVKASVPVVTQRALHHLWHSSTSLPSFIYFLPFLSLLQLRVFLQFLRCEHKCPPDGLHIYLFLCLEHSSPKCPYGQLALLSPLPSQ